jgi:hypothetical protein
LNILVTLHSKFMWFAKETRATLIIIISVFSLVCRSTWDNSALTGQFFIKFYFYICFEYNICQGSSNFT